MRRNGPVIVSDKSAHKLFVYGLDGTGKYAYPLQHRPGNIDIIYNFPFHGELMDIVGFNTRSTTDARFVFYKVERTTGRLEYLGSVKTDGWAHELYGFCLYYGVKDRILYAFGCDKSNVVQQYRLFVDGSGHIAGKKVRRWVNGSNEGPTEGLVADMEHGLLYAANEKEGIYVYLINENKPARPIRHLGIEKGQLEIDVEGLAIYYAEEGKGYLIASSQAQNYFSIFERSGDNNFAGRFYVKNVGKTDGIDVTSAPLDAAFHYGLFACHEGIDSPHRVELISWEDIANSFQKKLLIDTSYWIQLIKK